MLDTVAAALSPLRAQRRMTVVDEQIAVGRRAVVLPEVGRPRRRVLGFARLLTLLLPDRLEHANVLRFEDLHLDPDTRDVGRGRRSIELTPIEFRLLEVLLGSPRCVLTRPQISNSVWGYDFGVMSNSLNVFVGNLRRKTEAAGEPRLIHTVRGVGYVLRKPRL